MHLIALLEGVIGWLYRCIGRIGRIGRIVLRACQVGVAGTLFQPGEVDGGGSLAPGGLSRSPHRP